jgi:hypothetical protein
MASSFANRHDDEPASSCIRIRTARPPDRRGVHAGRFGRVSMVAAAPSARAPSFRGLLNAFQPLALSWAGAGELKTLIKARVARRSALPGGSALLCGFYLNELC